MPSAASDQLAPIFIHAPWRSGSTFLFELFRRHQERFYCFQEPLNDWAIRYHDDPAMLLNVDASLNAGLRHPSLEQPYFQELHDIHTAWVGKLDKVMLYDDYFGSAEGVDTAGFFAALIDASPRRPVIQECRTLGRIGALKAKLGGYHLAALRNPIDLWWSQKVNDFFAAGRALIINAAQPPAVIERFREKVGFQTFHDADLMTELDHFRNGRLDGVNSYLELHLIWSLAVIEAVRHADLVINMDQLSADPAVAARHTETLDQAGFGTIALSECRMPLRRLTQPELDRFTEIEAMSFSMLEEAGEPVDLIRQFLADTETPRPLGIVSDDQREAAQYREIVWRMEDWQAHRELQYLHFMAPEGPQARIAELEKYYVDLSGAVRELDERLTIESNKVLRESEKVAAVSREAEAARSSADEQLLQAHARNSKLAEQLEATEGKLAGLVEQSAVAEARLADREAMLREMTQRMTSIENDWVWRSTQFMRPK